MKTVQSEGEMAGRMSSPIQALRVRILSLSRAAKQFTMVASDVAGYSGCVVISAWLLFEGEVALNNIAILMASIILVAIPLTWYLGLYRSIIRYMGIELVAAATFISAVTAIILGVFAGITGVIPDAVRWAIVIWALSLIYIVSGRLLARLFLNRQNVNRDAVIIYGAGDGGARLTAALFGADEFLPVAIVDDKADLHGKRICGLEVYSPSHIGQLIRETGAARVLLALPTAPRSRRRAILERLSDYPVHVQTIPEIGDLVSGKAQVDDIREVDIEDLLGRDAVPPDPKLLRASIDHKTVMVTGAGGSIGSELCRQILQLRPRTLVLFELSEAALYSIDRELQDTARNQGIDSQIVALLGSAVHLERVREILKTFNVDTVYHAAAYKHVPVVEQNLLEGMHNNIFGTLQTAKAAIDAKVETFVLVSTDKAVSPTSVMGATKRFSELVLQGLQDEHPAIKFCMVRFGNVLASSGSVVPLFLEQIRNGGPVTVTHREIIRYFMTITEAAQLVIQAGALARGGDVFVLDMGKPVKITDLARRMINLMGLTVRDDENPDGEIEIQFTGLRPAEKLYEELLIGNNVSGTEHPRIMRATEDYVKYETLKLSIDELLEASLRLDRDRARDVLLKTVSGYEPNNSIEDLVWVTRKQRKTQSPSDTVIDISSRRP